MDCNCQKLQSHRRSSGMMILAVGFNPRKIVINGILAASAAIESNREYQPSLTRWNLSLVRPWVKTHG